MYNDNFYSGSLLLDFVLSVQLLCEMFGTLYCNGSTTLMLSQQNDQKICDEDTQKMFHEMCVQDDQSESITQDNLE